MEKYNQSIVIHPLFHLAATSSELPNLKAAFFGRSQWHSGRCGKHFLQVLSVLCVPYLLNLYIKIFGLGSGFKCSMSSEQVRNNPSARSPALFFLQRRLWLWLSLWLWWVLLLMSVSLSLHCCPLVLVGVGGRSFRWCFFICVCLSTTISFRRAMERDNESLNDSMYGCRMFKVQSGLHCSLPHVQSPCMPLRLLHKVGSQTPPPLIQLEVSSSTERNRSTINSNPQAPAISVAIDSPLINIALDVGLWTFWTNFHGQRQALTRQSNVLSSGTCFDFLTDQNLCFLPWCGLCSLQELAVFGKWQFRCSVWWTNFIWHLWPFWHPRPDFNLKYQKETQWLCVYAPSYQ